MKKAAVGIVAALATVAVVSGAQAQLGPMTPFALEIRGGAAVPTGDWSDFVNAGYTIGVNGQYALTPMIGIYAGFSLNSFGFADDPEFDVDGFSWQLRGLDAGVRAAFGAPGLSPFVRGGIVYYEPAIRGHGESESFDFELGFEVGGGLEYSIGPRISVTPGASFVVIEDMNFFKVDVGLRIRL